MYVLINIIYNCIYKYLAEGGVCNIYIYTYIYIYIYIYEYEYLHVYTYINIRTHKNVQICIKYLAEGGVSNVNRFDTLARNNMAIYIYIHIKKECIGTFV
jgi:hypothetical protein